jgi:hypothetical protein
MRGVCFLLILLNLSPQFKMAALLEPSLADLHGATLPTLLRRDARLLSTGLGEANSRFFFIRAIGEVDF